MSPTKAAATMSLDNMDMVRGEHSNQNSSALAVHVRHGTDYSFLHGPHRGDDDEGRRIIVRKQASRTWPKESQRMYRVFPYKTNVRVPNITHIILLVFLLPIRESPTGAPVYIISSTTRRGRRKRTIGTRGCYTPTHSNGVDFSL